MATESADIRLPTLGGMTISLTGTFYLGTVLVGMVFFLIGVLVFREPVIAAVVGSAVLVLLHWLNEVLHNFGHFTAARSTGFPMVGVRLGRPFLVFGTSLYPADEGELSAAVHLRRAMGGPVANGILGLAGIPVTLALLLAWPQATWVGLVWTAENLLVFSLGNFLPLGFNDGSTILHWVRRR